MSVGYSFTNKQFIMAENNPLRFVGLDNYVRVFTSPEMLASAKNIAIYVLMVVPAITIFSLLLAVLMNNRLAGMGIFRAISFSPQIVSMTVVAIVWAFIMGASKTSILNSVLGFFGIEAQGWLRDPGQALGSIAFMTVWTAVGFNMIIILAGLQFIPKDLYEAASLDGANALKQLWSITIPMLKPTLVFVVITNVIAALKLFTQVLVLTQGGPMNSTISPAYLIYETGFTKMQVGLSAAQSVVFFVAVLTLSLFQSKVLLKEKD
jgi:ABC-type sugar transport system permease subunit